VSIFFRASSPPPDGRVPLARLPDPLPMGEADEIQRILGAKDFYAILGVPRNVEEDELRRQYKRLALICHPDKCSHPKAEDAFKAVGKAFSTLSDPQKRRQYDRFGEEGVQTAGRPTAREANPEDIYDIFAQMFGAEFQNLRGQQFHHTRMRRAAPQPQGPQPVHPAAQFTQLLPLLLFFLTYLLFSIGGNESVAPYSLHVDLDRGYSLKRKTRAHKIPYYVRQTFASDFGRDATRLQQVEEHVYDSYKGYLNRKCQYEQREKAVMRQRANTYYTGRDQEDMLRRADEAATPACDEIRELIARYGF